jgi:hypothetical protein
MSKPLVEFLCQVKGDVAEIDRDDEGLGERLAVGGAGQDPVFGGDHDAPWICCGVERLDRGCAAGQRAGADSVAA